MRLRFLIGLCLGLAGRAQIAPAEAEVRFWQARCDRDPADAFSPTRLGLVCLKQLRTTGRNEWETQAESALRLSLKRDPQHVPAMVAMIALCLRVHRFTEAQTLADNAVRLAPDQADALAARGDARLELGQLAAARVDYERVAERAPGLAAQSRLARLEFLEGHPAEAAARLERALAEAPAGTSPETLAQVELQLGELRFRAGDFDRAEALYERARKHAPDLPVTLDHLAELQGGQGKHATARELFETLATRTERPEYRQAVGDLFTAAGDTVAAKTAHDQALAGFLQVAGKNDRRYDHHLAVFFSDVRRDATAAVKWAQRDFDTRDTAFTEDALAWALHLQGESSRAKELLAKALASGIQDAQLFFHAAMIFLSAGDKTTGQQWLARAAAVNPRYQAYHFHR
jgi:tetratricopeptide (TPR) repeat protein